MPFESKTKYGTQRDNTELILRTLEGIKRVLQSTGTSGGSATLAEQLIQTTALGAINTTLDQTINNRLIEIRDYLQNIDLTTVTEFATLNNSTLDVISEIQALNTLINSEITLLTTIENHQASIEADVRLTRQYESFENWDKIIGNSKVFTWIVGSISPFVVSTIEYKTGITTVFTQTFTYDGQDNVLTVTAS